MSKHALAYLFYGIGFCGLLFSLIRTYYLFWKLKKERETKIYQAPASRAQ